MRNPDDVTLNELWTAFKAQDEKFYIEYGRPSPKDKENDHLERETHENIRNPDDMTLEEIYAGFDAQVKGFDAKGVDRSFHEMFPTELKHYALVKPFEAKTRITVGDIIRHTKRNYKGISRRGLVVKIVHTYEDVSVDKGPAVDYFVLGRLPLPKKMKGVKQKNELWEIYPDNHYIFKYDSYIADQQTKIAALSYLNKSQGKLIELPPKMRNRVLKHMGQTDEQINRDNENNKRVKDIIKADKNKRSITFMIEEKKQIQGKLDLDDKLNIIFNGKKFIG